MSKLTFESQRLVATRWSRAPASAAFDAASGKYTLHLPLQGAGGMRGQLGVVTGVAKEKLDIVTQDVGGSFGVRGAAYPEYFAVMLAAQKLGRAVKWVGTRSEIFLTDFQGRALSLTGELALGADGRMLAIRFDDRADLGAYAAAFGPYIARRTGITMAAFIADAILRAPAAYQMRRRCQPTEAPGVPISRIDRALVEYARTRMGSFRASSGATSSGAPRCVNDRERAQLRFRRFSAVIKTDEARDWYGFAEGARRASRRQCSGIGLRLSRGGGGGSARRPGRGGFDQRGGMTLFAGHDSSGRHETCSANRSRSAWHRCGSIVSSAAAGGQADGQRHGRVRARSAPAVRFDVAKR